jgi:hypothetical protein
VAAPIPGGAPSVLKLAELIRTRPAREVAVAFAEIDDALKTRLAEAPDDYVALVSLGELRLRAGRAGDARVLLERASFQQPPSWEAFQYVNALLRRAEVLAAREFRRGSGAGLPGGDTLRGWARRLSGVRGDRRGSA